MTAKRSAIVRCAACVYWERIDEAKGDVGELGFCRRVAPSGKLDTPDGDYEEQGAEWIWPMTTAEAGCAEGRE